jgi:hypothetical protein
LSDDKTKYLGDGGKEKRRRSGGRKQKSAAAHKTWEKEVALVISEVLCNARQHYCTDPTVGVGGSNVRKSGHIAEEMDYSGEGYPNCYQ